MSCETEIWLPVDITDGRFEVSDHGNVREALSKRVRSTRERGGYLRVCIEKKVYSVHRLVAVAFLPACPTKPYVNHIDGNKANNRVENLQWVTHSENISHAYSTGLSTPKRGSSNGASKLTEDQVRTIRQKYASGGVRQVDLAAEFGCNQHNISLIIRREKWAHV